MERKYYEAYDSRYDQVHSLGLQWFYDAPSDIVLKTVQKYAISKGDSILEVGCGEGRDAIRLLDLGYDLIATDISPTVIEYCKKKFPKHMRCFQTLDCLSEKMDRKFDFIYAIAVVHMLVEDPDRDKFYSFIYEHLSNGGIALICSMGDGSMEFMTDINNAFEVQPRIHEKSGLEVQVANTSCRMVTFHTFQKEIEQAALSVIEQGITSVVPDFPCMMYAVLKRNESDL